jgi:putative transposase
MGSRLTRRASAIIIASRIMDEGLVSGWAITSGDASMSRNYYSEIHLHLVWHTKKSAPMLTSKIEPFVHNSLRGKIVHWPGAYVHEIGGTATHVHLAVSIVPTITISEFIGQLKGASSHEANHRSGRAKGILEWQAGYGVVSFGRKDLPWVVDYIRNQKEHHRTGQVYDRLERMALDHAAQAIQHKAP